MICQSTVHSLDIDSASGCYTKSRHVLSAVSYALICRANSGVYMPSPRISLPNLGHRRQSTYLLLHGLFLKIQSWQLLEYKIRKNRKPNERDRDRQTEREGERERERGGEYKGKTYTGEVVRKAICVTWPK